MSAIGEMIVKVGLTMETFSKGMATVESRLDKFQRELKKTGRDLTQAITVPIAGIATVAFASSEQASRIFGGFKDRVTVIMGELGDQIVKSLDLNKLLYTVTDALAAAVKWFDGLSASTKKTIIVMAGLAAALGPLLIVLEKVISVISFFFLTPIGLLTAAIVAAGYGVYKLAENFGAFDEKMSDAARSTEAQAIAMEKLNHQNSIFRVPGTPYSPRAAPAGHEYVPFNQAAPGFQPKAPGAQPREVPEPEPWRGVTRTPAVSATPLPIGPFLAITRQLRDSFIDIQTSAELAGGGINVVKASTDALTSAYKKLLLEGHLPNEEAMVNIRQKIEALQTPTQQFMGLLQQIPPIATQLAAAMFNTFQTISQGIGDAVAQVIVYGASLMEVTRKLLKVIAAEIISTLVKIGVQYVITAAIKKVVDMSTAASAVASGATRTYAEVFAQISSTPFGWLYAAGIAAAAAAVLIAGAAAFGAEEGGLFTRPGITRIAEKGRPEIVLNQDNVRKFMGGATGGGRQTINVYLDSDVIISKVVRGMPEYLRLQGAI